MINLLIEGEDPFLKMAEVVKLVDGPTIRNTKDVRFIGGGNHHAYPKLVPKGEVWIENTGNKKDEEAILLHEEVEEGKMRKGESYGKAHDEANTAEAKFRGAPKAEKDAAFSIKSIFGAKVPAPPPQVTYGPREMAELNLGKNIETIYKARGTHPKHYQALQQKMDMASKRNKVDEFESGGFYPKSIFKGM